MGCSVTPLAGDGAPVAASGGRSAVPRAMFRFVAGSVLALVAVGIATLLVANNVAQSAALRDAGNRGGTFGRAAASSLINEAVRRGNREQLVRLDFAMRNRLLDGSIVHIKMWDRDGTIIWSDEIGISGRKFELEHGVGELFGTVNVIAGMTDRSGPENDGAAGGSPQFEVYAGAWDVDGVPVVVESYWSSARLAADRRATLRRIAPLALGSLAFFQFALLPLALSLARRVDRGQAERTRMLRHALAASELEGRRIAQDLHDGVIQDLSGLGYVLPTVYAQLPSTARADAARIVLQNISTVVARDVVSLRSLLTDLYTERLASGGLSRAVDELATAAAGDGVAVEVDVDGAANETLEVTQLAFRIIREGLRNVVRHAHASKVRVRAVRDGAMLLVSVEDDGVGLLAGDRTEEGHLGLRLLGDLLADVGGRLDLSPGAGGGATLAATFPVGFADNR